MRNETSYAGKTVVVTGASSGFGEGTAVELVRRGANVVLAARSIAKLRELVAQCDILPGQALAVETDVGCRDAVHNLMSESLRRFGQVDVWINNAGAAAVGRFDVTPLEDHEKVLQTDLLGTIYGSHCALRHFRERNTGTLINVASVIGKIPAPLYASYVAAKFGVVGLSDAVRQELHADKVTTIRVCTVMPMAHDTEFFEHAANYTGKQTAPIPPTYDPKVTIDKLVELVIDPQDEVITGWQGSVFNFFHKLMPNAVESLMTANTKKAQLEKAPSAARTRGALYEAGQS